MIRLSRRHLVLSTLALAACSRTPAVQPKAQGPITLQDVVAGAWRPPADKARDAWRHPVESLQFWGLKPGQTVIEFWPGTGWYTDILAPYLAANGGKLYAAQLQQSQSWNRAVGAFVVGYEQHYASNPKLYGKVELAAFGPTTAAVAPPGSADLVIFALSLHDMMAQGLAEKALRDAYAALKPGGVLGIEEHRADPSSVPDPMAANGYVQQAYVVKLAEEAGFRLDGASEINANPKDVRDHPFGVWTLPPVRRSSPLGQAPNPAFDHKKYDAIGESDRMTLRLVKPQTAQP